ncbi:MAG TPA: T9SS type A sorting domain-containing protein [Ignavibacteriaceae bacterium]|nr:T9SS type A sorting domain-containing protein [Ignavibacteriaceae bacterium]
MENRYHLFQYFISILFFFSLFITITLAQDSLYLVGTLSGESSEQSINYPSAIGDINNDGFDDFILRKQTGVPSDPTVMELYLGSSNFDLNPDVIFHFPGNYYYHYLGSGYGIGDVNNDGYDDFVLVGQIGPITESKVFLYYGGQTIDTIPVNEFSQPDVVGSRFGDPVVKMGDINKDGYNDFAICADYNWSDEKGYVYLFWGGDTISWEKSITLTSNTIGDFFGASAANIGDINNDDFDDIAVGAPAGPAGYDTCKVFIYSGGSQISNIPDTVIISELLRPSEAGKDIKNANDLNKDGITDFCTFWGPGTKIYLNGLQDPLTVGSGYSFDAGGDINGDGYSDLIFGDEWRIRVYLGADVFDLYYDLNIVDDDSIGFSHYVSFAGDINNDGYDEILAMAPDFPDPENSLGKLFLFSYHKPTAITNTPDASPAYFHLFQNYPNPFNPSTTIRYSVPKGESYSQKLVQLKVFDILGNEVVTLVNQEQLPGEYNVEFNASKYNLSSGTYFCKLNIKGGGTLLIKMILIK